jgi:hypothetical protein
MKVFVAALLFAAVAAVGVFTTGGARVGDPGNNLTGPG